MPMTTATLAELATAYRGWDLAEEDRDGAVYIARRRYPVSSAALRYGMSNELEATSVSKLETVLEEEAQRACSLARRQDVEPGIGGMEYRSRKETDQ